MSELPNRPDAIILGVGSHIVAFRKSVEVLPLWKEFDEDVMIQLIFEYICGVEYAKSNMLEFSSDAQEIFEDQHPEADIRQFQEALLVLSKEIVKHLLLVGAFQEGVFWYEFRGFCLNDLILGRITKEDLIN